MGGSARATVREIYRYPVKGLSGERLGEAALAVDDGVPGDRVFALALPGTEFDEDDPVALSKRNFLMLQRDERLAGVRTAYDPATGRLTVEGGDGPLTADLASEQGRRAVEDFFGVLVARTAGTSGAAGRRAPRLVAARGRHRFTDAGPSGETLMHAVSILNLASIRDFAEKVGSLVDPLRFRANFHLEGLAAWAEREWIGQEITLGPVRLRVLADIPRCAATTVNPVTARRDLKVLKKLASNYGHTDFGVYAQVLTAGMVRPGDPVGVPGAAD
jgi:uncharacterized protein YcbX